MPTLLYQQSNVEVFWDEKEQWLYVKWIGPQSAAELQRDFEQMLRLLVARNADSLLNDNSHIEGRFVSVADWGVADWFPKLRQAGLRYFAWVLSPDRVSQVAADAILEVSAPGSTQIFWSVPEAANWLRMQRRRDAARTQRIVLPPGLGQR